MKRLFTLYILVFLSFISFNSAAYTYIYSGNVSGNWTSSGSPYYVFGDITIADNTTLTIDPGVEVNFVGHYKLAVQGRLLAIGQDSNYISIKAYYISTGFKGIRFDNTASTNDSSKLIYCNILYGKANAGTFEEKQGGALFVKGFSKLLVQNCVISNNLATNYGGAISCRTGASPTISNNIICNNQSGSNGGAIYMYSSSNPLLVGNTIVNNYASSSGGGIYANGTTPYITNSIIYGNEAAYSADNLYPSTLNIVYFCDIEGGYSNGYYNIDADPLFISPSSSTGTSSKGFNSNWRLQSSSPCIDEGYQSISFGFDPLYDLDGYIRVDHDDMDMGAYEYVQSTQFCGNITTNTSWSGQILVNCDVTVNHGVTLSIAPGTKVLFNGHHKFEIKGRVLAQGSKDSFIIMSAYNKNVGWKGIRYSGVSSSNDTTKFQYCKITYGKANGTSYPDYYGGGFYITGGKIIVENCMIANNYSSRYGGGIYATNLNGTSRISNNLIVNNEAEYYGGGMFLSSCSGIIANNTLSKNQVNLYYGGAAYIYNVPGVINCIFYDNYRTNASSYKELYTGGSTSITYSCIEGGFSGTGNISSDPLFTYPSYSSGIDYDGLSYRDWSLQSTSPCINAGSPSITGLYLPTNDLVGKERVFNSRVDMGPYEDKSFITVCGNISNSTTWDANKVKITCDVTVQPGVTLTIDPGVIVEFQGNFSIRVKGNILAEGTLTDSIQFTPINSWTGWAGLLYDSISGSQDSSLFKYCIFDHANRAATNRYFDGGGAIMIRSFGKIRMNYSRFSNNRSQGASSSQYDRGGAISIYACSPIIQNNIFYSNRARYGGSLHLYVCNSNIKNNQFINDSAQYGGSIRILYSKPYFCNNYFSNNYAKSQGGAIYFCCGYDASFVNNCFVNNESGAYGGAFDISSDIKPSFFNNTICNNKAVYGGAFFLSSNADPLFKNNIIYGNVATSGGNQFYLNDVSSDPKFYNCLIEGDSSSFGGNGAGINYGAVYLANIDINPSFSSPSGGAGKNYHGISADWKIGSTSPCINLGTSDTTGLSLPTLDLSNNKRIYNGRIDIGAYENQDAIYANCNITSNTNWDADTIKVNCDITINNGVTLTINPGTFVEFQGNFQINVKGRILAEGTASEKITFAVSDTSYFYSIDSFERGGWQGIRFNSTLNTNDTSKIIHCNLHYGKGERRSSYSYYGGAIFIYNYSKVIIANSLLSNNLCGNKGGAIYIESGNPEIINNTIVNNSTLPASTYHYGGAIYLDDANPLIKNNTIANNSSFYGGGIYCHASTPTFSNNIIYGNTTINTQSYYGKNIYVSYTANPSFYNNNIEGGKNAISGYSYIAVYNNNISTDPLFINPTSGVGVLYDGIQANWSIQSASPNINRGRLNTSGLFDYDIDGNARIIADTVDIGSYECQISDNFLTLQPVGQDICLGSSATFSTATSVGVVYQWQKDSVNIPYANSSSYTISSVSLADSGYYACILSNAFGSISTDTVYLNILSPPAITSDPSALLKCLGDAATFEVSANGSTPITYQWYNTNGQLGGATNSSYTINSASLNDASNYYCIATNSCSSDQSNGANLSIRIAPTMSSLTPSNTICETTNITFASSATGSDTISYQWYKNLTSISSASSSSYNITSAATSDAGNYYCKASNACGSDSTNIAVLTVNTKPQITTQSSSTSVCEGSSMTFSVTASGTAPLNYQWYKNSVSISGATNNTFTINSASTSDAATYYCIVSNSCGSVQSSNIVLTVKETPEISSQSSSFAVCKGSSANFSVTATGSTPLSYQWYKDNVSIGGATNSTYPISSTSASSAATYSCIVSNSCGNITSSNIVLTINTAPVITAQTATSVSVCSGQSMTFSITATGTTPLSYQWYDGSGAISGATGNTYTINSVSSSDAGNYYCSVSNSCSPNATSSTIVLTVNTAPTISAQSTAQTVCNGSAANFSVTASGSPIPSYQWYYNNSAISSANNNQYAISSVSSSNAGSYYCIITNSCGATSSTTKALTVNSAPSINSQTGSSVALCVGQSMTFSVNATGTAPLSYQWYNGSGAIGGASGSNYTINSITTSDAGTYYCVVSNSCSPNATSSNIVLTVNSLPVISAQSGDITVCSGSSANFSVSASGSPSPSYQWYYNNSAISTATNNQYAISSASSANAGSYYCLVTNSCGTTTSSSKLLTINSAPSITAQTSSSVSRCSGQNMTFSVTATGTAPLYYQWYNGNGSISGASGSIYTIASVSTAHAGTYYCVVSNSCSPNATSNNIALTVLTAPSLTAQSADQTVCNGAAANFSVTASGSPSPSYQWYYNNSAISTATNNQYAISSASSANAGSYYCLVSNSCGTVTSSSKLLTINTAPSITAQTSSSVSRCSGQNMTFSVTATGTAPLYYQWYNGNGVISGASGSTYTIASVSTANAGTYYCVVSNICTPNATSNNIALTVFTSPSLTAQSADQTVCSGSAANFSVSVSSSPASTYQWYKNASPIASAKNKQYLIGSVSTSNAGSYYCIATNSCGSIQSNAAILTVNIKPTVSSISDSTTECVGNSAVMNVVANGTNPLSYQWYQNLTPIQNATNSFHLISSVKLADQGNYYCVVSNGCGNDYSNSLQMLVNSPVQINSESGDSIQCENGEMRFEVNASGTAPINYQWYNDKGNISGATSNTYTINDLSVSDAGNYYCEITNPCGSVYSLIKKLTVKKLPVVSLGQDTVFCYGGSIVLSPGSGYFCLWNTGSINPEYEVKKRGDYYVQVTDKYGCQAYSDTVFVDVLEPFASEDICVVSGDPVTGKNLIAWERTQGQRTAYYNIYRETTATGVYEKIASRLFDSISVYVDYNSNPKQRAYRYRITAVDSCGNESDPSNHHKTIHLTVNQGVGNTNNLIWSHYEGFTFSSYLIYRGTHPDSLSQLDIIQSNLNSYTDINPPVGLLYYRVAVLMPDTCNPQIFRGQTSKGPFTQSMSNMKDYNSKQSDYMEAYPALISIDSNYGASGSLEVFTNLLEWDVKSSQRWLAVERDLTSKTITVTALETNNLDYARTAYVDITSNDLPAFTVTVMQKGGDNTISIADFNDTEGKLIVYPNPFSTETNFEIPAFESKIELLEIIDASGQIVFVEKDIVGNTYALRDMNLSKGLYFVRIVTDRIYSAKIMVK